MEFIQFFFQNLMLLFICLSALGMLFAVTLLIMPCIAAPIYASMIFIELFVSTNNKTAPEFIRFKQPSDSMQRYWMDLIACIATFIAGAYIWLLHDYRMQNRETEFWKLFLSYKLLPPILPAVFCVCIVALYWINSRNNEDNRHPITKLKDLCKFPSIPLLGK